MHLSEHDFVPLGSFKGLHMLLAFRLNKAHLNRLSAFATYKTSVKYIEYLEGSISFFSDSLTFLFGPNGIVSAENQIVLIKTRLSKLSY